MNWASNYPRWLATLDHPLISRRRDEFPAIAPTYVFRLISRQAEDGESAPARAVSLALSSPISVSARAWAVTSY